MISSMIGLQQRGEKDQRVNQILENNKLRIQSIATVHEILCHHDYFEEIYFYEYITKLTDIIIKMSDSHVRISVDKESAHLPSKDIIKLGIITNELLTNSIKHAFTDIDGAVEISLKEEERHLIYRYKDNGNKKIKIETKDSLGHKLIGMMVQEMDAQLSLSIENGLAVEIKIPLVL